MQKVAERRNIGKKYISKSQFKSRQGCNDQRDACRYIPAGILIFRDVFLLPILHASGITILFEKVLVEVHQENLVCRPRDGGVESADKFNINLFLRQIALIDEHRTPLPALRFMAG